MQYRLVSAQSRPSRVPGDLGQNGQAFDELAAVVREQPRCGGARAALRVDGIEYNPVRVDVQVLDPVGAGDGGGGVLRVAGRFS